MISFCAGLFIGAILKDPLIVFFKRAKEEVTKFFKD